MDPKRHALATFAAFVVGALLVALLRPETSGGVVFVVTGCVLLFNAVAVLMPTRRP